MRFATPHLLKHHPATEFAAFIRSHSESDHPDSMGTWIAVGCLAALVGYGFYLVWVKAANF